MKTESNWFGPHLQELRNHAGLTQEDLSELAQVNPQTVKDWDSGRKRPHLDRLPVLATVLGVGLERMLPPIAPAPAADRVEDTLPPEASVEARLARIERQLRRVLEDLQELKGR